MRATYWNGHHAPARKVLVRVPEHDPAIDPPQAWWAGIEEPPEVREALAAMGAKSSESVDLRGQTVEAVQVTYGGATFLLYDGDGSGWAKVTEGRGSPRWGSRSLPDRCVLVAAR